MDLGWVIFAAGACMGACIGIPCGLAIRRTDTAPAPPACPFDGIPPGPPELRIVPRVKPYDWSRDGAA